MVNNFCLIKCELLNVNGLIVDKVTKGFKLNKCCTIYWKKTKTFFSYICFIN